jgi:transmembrane sensor
MAPISEELLDRFLKGVCTEEEAAAVEAYFQEHPEDIFLLGEYDAADAETPLPEDYRGEMLAVIEQATAGKARGRISVMRTWVAAVAAAVILLGVGWWLVAKPVKQADKTGQVQLAAVWVGRHNADNQKIRLLLPDSSEATLSPGATIRYRKDFGQYGKREVKVEGQAAFAVVRDDQQPFIVYSDRISTTVLGTVFEVTAEKDSDQIKVRLLAGKVMVSYDPLAGDSLRRYVLAPGQEFIFAKADRSVVIREFRNHGGGYAYHRITHLPGRPDSLANWYMFNNQTLSDVFDQLSLLYDVDIQYSRKDLYNDYFIGKLEMKDSLSKIMRDIALLNHLTVRLTNGVYVVKKR